MLETGGHSGMEPGRGADRARVFCGIFFTGNRGAECRDGHRISGEMITSALCNASAGEYAGFTMIAAGAAYIEMAIVTLIANARYLLMSCAMSQRMDPDMPFFHRLLMAFDITDELFGITIARPAA